MTQQRPYVRKHYFIKKDYQAKFILKFCLLVLLGCLLSMAILFFLSNETLTSTFENSRLLVRKTGFAILPSIILTNLITLVIIGFATIGVVLFISHKIAGPIFRFEKELKLIGQGDLTIRISLRKHDQLKDLSNSLNTMTESLDRKLAGVLKEIEETLAVARRPDVPEEMKTAAAQLHRRFLDGFTLTPCEPAKI
jgi:methyl-accepting chemotaxis protein